MKKSVELVPIKETPSDFDALEKEIKKIFRQEIYLPLIAETKVDQSFFMNDEDELLAAIRAGRITFYRGTFRGKLTASLTKSLRQMGATWDKTVKAFKFPMGKLPDAVRTAVTLSESNANRVVQRIVSRLDKMEPEKIASSLKIERIFDRLLAKTDSKVRASLKGISVGPNLTEEGRARIASEYTQNLQKYIQDFTEKETLQLRKNIERNVFSGNRYESMIKTIKQSYGVSERKAKFLARQETSLLITKFKQVRYEDAGVEEYKWKCVAGSANHPVRPMHKALENKIFKWSNPPTTDEKGNRNNPGQDYNCRCYAVPIVRF